MVAGRVLVRDGEVLTEDESAIRAGVQVQAEEVARRVAADLVHKGMALLEAIQAGLLWGEVDGQQLSGGKSLAVRLVR